MPSLRRDDGVEIHWEARGEGPTLVFLHSVIAQPHLLRELLDDLALDHRVITYDPRGTGDSSRQGPYEPETDAADLRAVIEEAGAPAVLMPMADAGSRSILLAKEHPDLVAAVAGITINPLPLRALRTMDSLAGSPSVIEALLRQIDTDYRGALRMLLTSLNPQMSEDEVRKRVSGQVEYCPQEAAVGRLRAWSEAGFRDEARSLGEKLTAMHFPTPWFPAEILDALRQELPDAHVVELEDGAVSRPDLTAAVVRRITEPARIG